MDRLRERDLPQGYGIAEIDSLTGILLSDIVNKTQRRKDVKEIEEGIIAGQ